MAELEFFSDNRYIAYPLQYRDVVALSPSGSLSTEWIVDAGFTLGLDSNFVVGTDSVYLHSILIGADITIDFRSTATGCIGYRWLFTLPSDTPFGTSAYAEATNISTGDPAYGVGTGFIVVGKLGKIGTTPLGPGLYVLTAPWAIEPALLQSLGATFARSLTIANAARPCPEACAEPSPSSGESTSAEPVNSGTYVFAGGLTGALKFKEGNNATIQVRQSDNTIQIGAAVGAGLGPACEDVIIDDNGFQRGNDCVNCDDLIKAIAGYLSVNGIIGLNGGPGVTVKNYPVEHLIVVTFSTTLACGSSSSG